MARDQIDSIIGDPRVILPDGTEYLIEDFLIHYCDKRGEISPNHWAPPPLEWWQCARCLWEKLRQLREELNKCQDLLTNEIKPN